MKKNETTSWAEWLIPFAFVLAAGWFVWHLPAFILDFLPHQNESLFAQTSAIHAEKDVTPNLPGLFGGFADPIDWLAVIVLPILAILGMRTIQVAQMEFQDWRGIDRFAIFIGRVTMILILCMTGVMLYEVFLRYAIEAPTLWANELTLWIGGFVFLSSGLYAMQQRSHIRIFIFYDVVPRGVQRLFDTLWTFLLCVFAASLVFGSYKQVFAVKFYRWETFGTAFDPPIPSTIQPFILIIIPLIALQAVLNLIADWNAEPVTHSAADDIDQEELEALKRAVGSDGVGDQDVTRGSIQGNQTKGQN
jgi:TRAP-type mannitol/chloroaromatic compound transport system permease small subunit